MKGEIDETHNPARPSWIKSANGHANFSVQNLPLGLFTPPRSDRPRGGVAVGDFIIDLSAFRQHAGLAGIAAEAAAGETLNALLALGAKPRRALRRVMFEELTDKAYVETLKPWLYPAKSCQLYVPATIGDYTDFYTGIHHAENVGRLFRPDSPLLPNYKHIPIGYHGRSSSIRPSGAVVRRPSGQTRANSDAPPDFGPTQKLDYELEMGIWVGPGNEMGKPISIDDAQHHIAGLCLLNDWSARDLQTWEYQPLGPFLAKSFTTTISPWIVTTEALAPFRIPQQPRPDGDAEVLPYLNGASDQAAGAFAVMMELHIETQQMRDRQIPPYRLCRGSMGSMYWTPAQLVTHHTSNGCNLRPGDLFGTGTLSGTVGTSLGSLLELSNGGRNAIQLPSAETRTFLQDGDEVTLSAWAESIGRARIGFGPCVGRISK